MWSWLVYWLRLFVIFCLVNFVVLICVRCVCCLLKVVCGCYRLCLRC